MTKVKKSFGTLPDDVVVLSTVVSFDAEGMANIEDQEIVDLLAQIPGYEVDPTEVVAPEPTPEPEPTVVTEDEPTEELPEEPTEAPAKAPSGLKRKQPKK